MSKPLTDYVLRYNCIEFVGGPTFLDLRRWHRNDAPIITLQILPHVWAMSLTPREAIVVGNALIDLAHNHEHWKHPPC